MAQAGSFGGQLGAVQGALGLGLQIPVSSFISHVTLGTLSDLSRPQFPFYYPCSVKCHIRLLRKKSSDKIIIVTIIASQHSVNVPYVPDAPKTFTHSACITLSAFRELTHLKLSIAPRELFLTLQRRELRTREVKEFAQGHTAT